MKMNNIFRHWLLILCAGVFSLGFVGCDDDNEQSYIYTIGIDKYQYSGSSLFGPLEYLQTLSLDDRFVITGSSRSKADAEAKTKFDTEMAKIDVARLDAYGSYYILYELQSLEGEQLATKAFGTPRADN